jgi:hypothetical protein
VNDGENFFTDGHDNALVTEASGRIFDSLDFFDDRSFCEDILFLPFL